jgi:glycosidase
MPPPTDRRARPTRRHLLAAAPLAVALLFAARSGAAPPARPAAAQAPPEAAARTPALAQDPGWARGAVFYEVLVRSFADSNGDGVGDLAGLLAKLDYLNDGNPKTGPDLGIDALCLLPLSPPPGSPENGADLRSIDPAYGAQADLDRLLQEAHRRGVRVLLDLAVDPAGARPGEMERLAAYWLAKGVDGLRFDAGDRSSARRSGGDLAARVHLSHPMGVEAPALQLDFPLAESLLKGVAAGDASGIAARLAATARPAAGAIDAPFLARPGQARVATRLGGDLAREKSAAAVLLTLPGAPFLYYGEEIGLQESPGAKDAASAPMPWNGAPGGGFTTGRPWLDFAPGRGKENVDAEAPDPGSLLTHYRNLIRARKNSAALRLGSLRLLSPATAATPLLAFLRETAEERVLVVHNLGREAVEAGPYAVAGRPDPLFLSPGTLPPAVGNGGLKVKLPAGATGIWRLR